MDEVVAASTGRTGLFAPVALVLFRRLCVSMFSLELSRRIRCFFQLRGSKVARAQSQLASRLYAERSNACAARTDAKSVSEPSNSRPPWIAESRAAGGNSHRLRARPLCGAPCDTTRLRTSRSDSARTAGALTDRLRPAKKDEAAPRPAARE